MSSDRTNTHVGRDVEHSAVLEVASRLLAEGLARLETSSPESVLVALRQAFVLERQFGGDSERLCRACAALCKALAKASHPAPPTEAVGVLLQALDTLEARANSGTAVDPIADEAATEFLARELLGLGRRLGSGAHYSGHQDSNASYSANADTAAPALGGGAPRVEELRAADRAYERLAQMAALQPLKLGGADLVLTQEECLYQLAVQARAIGQQVRGVRTSEAPPNAGRTPYESSLHRHALHAHAAHVIHSGHGHTRRNCSA